MSVRDRICESLCNLHRQSKCLLVWQCVVGNSMFRTQISPHLFRSDVKASAQQSFRHHLLIASQPHISCSEIQRTDFQCLTSIQYLAQPSWLQDEDPLTAPRCIAKSQPHLRCMSVSFWESTAWHESTATRRKFRRSSSVAGRKMTGVTQR